MNLITIAKSAASMAMPGRCGSYAPVEHDIHAYIDCVFTISILSFM